MKKKIKKIENNSISPIAILIAIIFAGAFFFLYKENSKPEKVEVAQAVQDPTFGWYLYQTKTNNLFQIKYPYSWRVTYGGGFVGEENLYVASPDQKTILKVMARSNEKYTDVESLLKDIDTANAEDDSFYLIKEEKITLDGNAAIRREEYLPAEKATTLITYVLKDKSVVQLQTDFMESDGLNTEQRSFHNLVADTLKFTN
ncbi:MAG: hypothetical protein Q8Q95_03035 [bacterium]|nr:hypothetical protein [bacterium]